jgi:hypothetical protein
METCGWSGGERVGLLVGLCISVSFFIEEFDACAVVFEGLIVEEFLTMVDLIFYFTFSETIVRIVYIFVL